MGENGFRFPVSGFRRHVAELRAGFAVESSWLIKGGGSMEPCIAPVVRIPTCRMPYRFRGLAAPHRLAAADRKPETGNRKP